MKRRTALLSGLALVLPVRGASADSTINLYGSPVEVSIEGEASSALRALIPRWITQSAQAVHAYYGKFPVPQGRIIVVVQEGAGCKGGQTMPDDVPYIRIRVGANSTESQLLKQDWVLVHEMIHLAFPWMNGAHNWMAEGLAVYVESIARVQAGHLKPAQIWPDFIGSMPKGLPGEGDYGIDVTQTWGRTYWGGALFSLIADVTIRQETGNAKGLQHALRAINAERDFRRNWPFRETLEVGDAATGRHVLASLYDSWKETPVSPDLPKLWADLGVQPVNPDAPLAAIPQAIQAPMAG